MKEYPKYKSSGLNWIDTIPSHWSCVRAQYLFDIVSGSTPNSNDESLWDGNINWITPADFNTDDHYIYKGKRTITQKGYNSCSTTILPIGSIIFSKRAPIGKVVITSDVLCTNQGCFGCSPNKDLSSNYFYYLMSILESEYNVLGSGSTFMEISAKEFRNFKLLVPPVNEQKAIARYLDVVTAKVDALMSEKRAQVEDLWKYRTSLITETVTRGLNPTTPIRQTNSEWYPNIPYNWNIEKFKYQASIKANLVHPEDYTQHPQISPDSIEKNTGRLLGYRSVEESGIISDNHLFFKGQIIYSKIRPNLNKVIIAPFDGLCSADMYPIETSNNVRYFQYLMLSNPFVSQVSVVIQDRVKMPKINQLELGEIFIVVPPISEQQEIADYLDEKTEKIDSLVEELEAQLKDLATYKQAVITEAVTGKVDVRDWKPNN